ncbi:LPP20 family lipoprotein [Sulfurimonas sp.]|uniref:LPP20 family lipoprotein n=1 Tax=Sulfurimonas sp. TaxID=2022749 RepID=UPI0025EA1758|nr:LPP20 family lipoprotein [Sulfurimonas sp.]MBW6489170.1 LPP20 family lipoprotein [Sulfurimonas sp.]
MNTITKYISITTTLLSLLFLAGCAAQKEVEVAQKKAPPSWYVNPPQTTLTTLYAVGEGEDRDEAVKNALNMMASTLSVSISSQFDSKKVVREGLLNTHQSTVVSKTQSDVKKIRISSYEVVESYALGFRNHIVLIKSQKQKLFESLHSELEQKFALADSQIDSLSSSHVLNKLNGYKKIKDEIKDVPDTLVVMNVLDGSYSSKEHIHKIERIDSAYEKLLSSISVAIECDSDSKHLEAPIREGFSSKGVRISGGKGSTHFRLNVKSNAQKASSYGFTLARYAIEISVHDYKGAVVASNKLNIVGQSTQGYEVAKESVAVKLHDMIKKEGIGKITGLDL